MKASKVRTNGIYSEAFHACFIVIYSRKGKKLIIGDKYYRERLISLVPLSRYLLTVKVSNMKLLYIIQTSIQG